VKTPHRPFAAAPTDGRAEPRAATSRAPIYAWLFVVCAALAIYGNSAPVLVRTLLVILAALFLGLLTYDLIATTSATVVVGGRDESAVRRSREQSPARKG